MGFATTEITAGTTSLTSLTRMLGLVGTEEVLSHAHRYPTRRRKAARPEVPQ
jgi:hypothetical protein